WNIILITFYKETFMGLINFLKETGEKLLGKKPAATNTAAATTNTTNPADAVQGILNYIGDIGLNVKDLSLSFDPATSVMTVKGEAPNKETKEKIVLCVGNVEGVASVDDQITCPADSTSDADSTTDSSQFY